MEDVTFVIPIGDRQIYDRCFGCSPFFSYNDNCEIFLQEGYPNAAVAFNSALAQGRNDLFIFAHQDVVLPNGWATRFKNQVFAIERNVAHLGVIGCVGKTDLGEAAGHFYRHDREFKSAVPLPARVETLDEMLIAFRRSSGLLFDEELPSFFYYAVDICLQAKVLNLSNFAIDCPVFHQARNQTFFSKGFCQAQAYMIEKWRSLLPVQTLSGTLRHKRINRIHRIKDFISVAIRGRFWENLPTIDPQTVLWQNREND